MPGLFFCAQVEGRASESAWLNGVEKNTETPSEQNIAKVPSILKSLLLIFVRCWFHQTTASWARPSIELQQWPAWPSAWFGFKHQIGLASVGQGISFFGEF